MATSTRFYRAVLETKIGFLRTATDETVNNITQRNIRDLWAQGTIHPESKHVLSCLNSHMTLNREEAKQLDAMITEFGQNAAGAVLTQIARHSPILNQSTVLSNEGYICAATYRINGSLELLYHASGIMNEITTCPVLKKDGSPCDCILNQDGKYHMNTHILLDANPMASIFAHTTAWRTLYTQRFKMHSGAGSLRRTPSRVLMMTNALGQLGISVHPSPAH